MMVAFLHPIQYRTVLYNIEFYCPVIEVKYQIDCIKEVKLQVKSGNKIYNAHLMIAISLSSGDRSQQTNQSIISQNQLLSLFLNQPTMNIRNYQHKSVLARKFVDWWTRHTGQMRWFYHLQLVPYLDGSKADRLQWMTCPVEYGHRLHKATISLVTWNKQT